MKDRESLLEIHNFKYTIGISQNFNQSESSWNINNLINVRSIPCEIQGINTCYDFNENAKVVFIPNSNWSKKFDM
jgi:hypothetical protein